MDWTETQPELRPEGVFGVLVKPGRTSMTQWPKSFKMQNLEATKSSIWP